MSTLLRLLARATDTKGYPDDKNPAHWRTINHSKVHVDAEGNIDGGAGKKFDGAKWTSTRHPHDPSSYPPPTVTRDNLLKAWDRVRKYQVAMKRAKGEAAYKKNADLLKAAIEEYEKLREKAPADVKAAHKPKIEAMKAFATREFTKPEVASSSGPLEALAASTAPAGSPDAPFPIWDCAKRKAARVFASPKEADEVLRGKLKDVWKSASVKEKEAAFVYSYSYKQFQEPLRGVVYGSGRTASLKSMPWDTLGVGSMGKKHGEVKGYIENLTSLISKSTYDKDITLVRGNGYDGIAALFGVDIGRLKRASTKELEELLVKREGKDEGFCSCGSSSGSGFDDKDVIMHIACPAGTQMLYLEPFAAYGGSSPYSSTRLSEMYRRGEKPKSYWDGKSEASKFGDQDETLIQRGTTYKATGVKRDATGKLHIYCQVIKQEPYKIP